MRHQEDLVKHAMHHGGLLPLVFSCRRPAGARPRGSTILNIRNRTHDL